MNEDDADGGDDMLRWYYGGTAPEGDVGDGPALAAPAPVDDTGHLDAGAALRNSTGVGDDLRQRGGEFDDHVGALVRVAPVGSRIGGGMAWVA